MNLDKSLDQPMVNFEGGTGKAMYHRGLDPSTFYTTWSYVDHLLLPPGTTVGPNTKPDMAEIYYVMSGDGTATISGETAQIHTGDAVLAALGESRAFAATGKVPLEFMVIGIARDLDAKKAYMLTDENRLRTGPR
jgi:mannose-6-phosphate isomerase-like protein (cupin superfamily)